MLYDGLGGEGGGILTSLRFKPEIIDQSRSDNVSASSGRELSANQPSCL